MTITAVPAASAPSIERLRSSRAVLATLRSRHRATPLVVMHVRPRQPHEATRLTVVASRRVGNAVRRNRAKRLLREAARSVSWARGHDVVLVARSATPDARLDELIRDVKALCEDFGFGAER